LPVLLPLAGRRAPGPRRGEGPLFPAGYGLRYRDAGEVPHLPESPDPQPQKR
jgi:hypothetical protein